MKFSELLADLPGVEVRELAGDPEIGRVVEDSRKVKVGVGGGDLFVAKVGTKVSGADFVKEALAKGAVAVVAEGVGGGVGDVPAGVAWARVSTGKLAVAQLAQKLWGYPSKSLAMYGVTGTKGKTTVTYLLRSILHAAAKTNLVGKQVGGGGGGCGLIGTVQLDDGKSVVPSDMTTPGPVELAELLARMRTNGATSCVMEISSHALDQQRVAELDFKVGMFTNLTGDHLDYHLTMENYAAAKAQLFAGLKPGATAVINADDPWAERMVRDCKAQVIRLSLKDGGKAREEGGSDWTAKISEMNTQGMMLEVHGRSKVGEVTLKFHSPLVGKHNAYNSLTALVAAWSQGIPLPVIVQGLQAMVGVPGRLEPVIPAGWARGEMTFQVFVDYAHTHDALENVLSALRATMQGRGKLICLFGCGGDRDRTKRPKMAAVAQRLADLVVLTSDNPRTEDPKAIIAEVRTGFSAAGQEKVMVEPDRRQAIRTAIALADAGDVVLLAGKGHENYQIIGTTKQHFDDMEEALAALQNRSGQTTVQAGG